MDLLRIASRVAAVKTADAAPGSQMTPAKLLQEIRDIFGEVELDLNGVVVPDGSLPDDMSDDEVLDPDVPSDPVDRFRNKFISALEANDWESVQKMASQAFDLWIDDSTHGEETAQDMKRWWDLIGDACSEILRIKATAEKLGKGDLFEESFSDEASAAVLMDLVEDTLHGTREPTPWERGTH